MRWTSCWISLGLVAILSACGGGGDESEEGNLQGGGGTTAGQGGGGTSAGQGGSIAGASGKGGSSGTGGPSGPGGQNLGGEGGFLQGGEGGEGGQGESGGSLQGGEGGEAGQGGSGGSLQGGEGGEAGQGGAGGNEPCGGCKEGFVCKYDVCVPNLGACGSNEDCPGDSYCDLGDMTCIPYGVPPGKINDPTCQKQQVPTEVTPAVQCEWTGPAAGDPTLAYNQVYSTPMVADLNLDLNPKKIQPSIVISTFTSLNTGLAGMLRVFDGRTCTEQMRIGGPDDPDAANNRPTYGAHWAIGDLDGDVGTPNGHPEIVGFRRAGLVDNNDPGEVVAFGIDTSNAAKPKLVRRWVGRDCKTNKAIQISNNSGTVAIGVMLHDLDDDGKPEVIAERVVFDSEGCALNPTVKASGVFSAVADVDLDGKPDLVRYDGIYGWDTAAKNWVVKPWSKPAAGVGSGSVAIADVGYYSEIPGHSKTEPLPEVIVVSSGKIVVLTLTGQIVFGPFPIYDDTGLPASSNRGGPPTAADFDGDGQIEFAATGATHYTVYDPDCVKNPDATARPGGVCSKSKPSLPEGILWAQPSQDKTSNVTGSSVFDFNGDGKAEVVYRDECFVRVYDGSSGTVLYSAPASSGTGYEYPVVADVDGDFATEIVVPRTPYGGCPAGPDKLYPKSGNFKKSTGFIVLRDPEDRWVSSRPIWNQHAYSITHVTDDARIPKSSEVKRNWEQPGLNNFRQNTQGSLKALALADLTVELQDAEALCSGQAGSFQVKAKVCNRGTNPVQDGAEVAFSQGKKGSPTVALCETVTDTLLQPGDCTVVTCTGELEAENDVLITVDPKKKIADCHPGNNQGASARLLCGKP